MKIKRIILSIIFITGIIVVNISCSQADEMDDGETGGSTRPPSGDPKATMIDSSKKTKIDSLIITKSSL